MARYSVEHSFANVEFVTVLTGADARSFSTSKPVAVLIVDCDDYFCFDEVALENFWDALDQGKSLNESLDIFCGY